MSYLMFARVFPSYHPRAGDPTFFPEKLSNFFDRNGIPTEPVEVWDRVFLDTVINSEKHHTIRAGHHWKVGDRFDVRVWSGAPYRSKHITLARDIEVKKVWNICIDELGVFSVGKVGEQDYYLEEDVEESIARNDGLDYLDFITWFDKKPFFGQIICWDNQIQY